MNKDIGNVALSLVNKVLDSMRMKGLPVVCELSSVKELFVFVDNCLSLMKFHYTLSDKQDYHDSENYSVLKQLVDALMFKAYRGYYRYDFDLFISSVMCDNANGFNRYSENDEQSIHYRNVYYEKFYKTVFDNWDNPDTECLSYYNLQNHNDSSVDVKRDLFLRALNTELFEVRL